jgi:hypothetical protein
MPEESRVFDIAKPGSTNPQPTSKPVIVGHHPAMSDPMVRDEDSKAPTHILVQDSQHEAHNDEPEPSQTDTSAAAFTPFMEGGPSQSTPIDDFQPRAASSTDPAFNTSGSTSYDSSPSSADTPAADSSAAIGTLGQVEGIHLPPKKRSPRLLKWFVVLLLLVVAGYLFVDSGVVNTGINLPFHVFKQKKAVAPAVSSVPPPAPKTPAVVIPNGFTQYKITGTNVSFASPSAWGTPASSIDHGYTARGGDNQPDSNYAYVVGFPNNKDIEMAVTSSKFLPPARNTLYYDFLGWCIGTNDGKYYFSVLKFSTTDKVDTPSTVTCDQVPVVTPTKVDNTTIVQQNIKSPDGKTTVGDVYTKNLTNKDLPVFRVKDATMTHADDVKKLLSTVKD